MSDLISQLAVNLPVGAALLVMAGMFLKYLKEERLEWRETILKALDNNTNAMNAQREMLKDLTALIEQHDKMSREAIARLEAATSSKE